MRRNSLPAMRRSIFAMFGDVVERLWIRRRRGFVEIEYLEISKRARGCGHGSVVMTSVCLWADANNEALELTVDPEAADPARLARWYGNCFGFSSVDGQGYRLRREPRSYMAMLGADS